MIRKLTAQDESVFLRLSGEFYRSGAVLRPIPAEYRADTFRELMRSEEYARAFLLEEDGVPAGYALLSLSFSQEAGGRVVWLEELYVAPAFRGRGLGGQFLRWLPEHVPAKRYRLEVEPDNARAQKLYRRAGFEALPYLQMKKGT